MITMCKGCHDNEQLRLNPGLKLANAFGVFPTDSKQACLKSQESLLDRVSTTCGSGWVDHETSKSIIISRAHHQPTRFAV